MLEAVRGTADRLVSLVVPKTTAGACPCGDCYISTCSAYCYRKKAWVCTNCNCQVTSIQCNWRC